MTSWPVLARKKSYVRKTIFLLFKLTQFILTLMSKKLLMSLIFRKTGVLPTSVHIGGTRRCQFSESYVVFASLFLKDAHKITCYSSINLNSILPVLKWEYKYSFAPQQCCENQLVDIYKPFVHPC